MLQMEKRIQQQKVGEGKVMVFESSKKSSLWTDWKTFTVVPENTTREGGGMSAPEEIFRQRVVAKNG